MINSFTGAMRRTLVIIAVIFLGSLSSRVSSAQGITALRQLDGRASPALKAQVTVIADSISHAGLPVGPLVDKTLEGISKGADDRRIMIAVRGVATDLGTVRHALGPASDEELAAGVAALRAGSSSAGLAQLRQSLPGRPLVVPLSVLASLMVQGAPAPSAIVAVVSNARQRNDSDLLAYGRGVSRDIASGVAPLTAITTASTTLKGFNTASGPLSSPIKPGFAPQRPTPKPKP
jgi:hypothetical protein